MLADVIFYFYFELYIIGIEEPTMLRMQRNRECLQYIMVEL